MKMSIKYIKTDAEGQSTIKLIVPASELAEVIVLHARSLGKLLDGEFKDSE